MGRHHKLDMGEAGCEPRPPEEDPPCTPADPYDELYEFEAWSLADLEKLTEALHEYATTVKDVFSISDDSWSQIAAATQREPAKLREAVWQGLAGSDMQQIHTSDEVATANQGSLFLGTLEAAENRLLVHFYQIRKILTLFSSEVDPLWESDSVEYKEVILDAENNLLPHIEPCIDFIGRGHRYGGVNVLVCCGTGIRRSASIGVAYLMSLDMKVGAKLERAVSSLTQQRPSVDISGGSFESVGGNGQGLMKALEMFEWELNAEAASGPRSPVLIAREGSFGEEGNHGKRKSPVLDALIPESPGTKKVKETAEVMSKFTL